MCTSTQLKQDVTFCVKGILCQDLYTLSKRVCLCFQGIESFNKISGDSGFFFVFRLFCFNRGLGLK